MTTAAGWYPDTTQVDTDRYWDGTQWTDHTRSTALQPSAPATPAAPPGWHRDPRNPSVERFWSGAGWTDDCRPVAQPAPAPLLASAPPAPAAPLPIAAVAQPTPAFTQPTAHSTNVSVYPTGVAQTQSSGVSVVANIVWLVFAGFWLAIGYVLAGIVNCITIIGIPFGLQSFKLAGYALWPFGRVVVKRPNSDAGLSTLGNVIWFILSGLWLALAHLLVGVLLCVTIIGIPLGVASFKMAGLAIAPFGKMVVSRSQLASMPGVVVVSSVG